MHEARLVAWGALLVLLYAYFGYPLLLHVLGRVRRFQLSTGPCDPPHVTMVIAAWNEESVISQKLENALAQDYPPELLDVVVVSDASTDLTDAIVERWARQSNRVQLLRAPGRQGKSAALNRAVPVARGEIVVLTDANAMFAPNAVDWLARPFGDPRVGAVSGQLHYRKDDETSGSDTGEGAYWRYEQGVKRAESALGSLVGANGSIYAIRRSLFRPLHSRDVNDFRIPYEALLQGFRVVLEPRAVSFEIAAATLWAEYRRKVRIMSRAIPMMLRLVPTTLIRGRFLALWQLISHKVLREIQGVSFLAMLGGAAWGSAGGDRWLLVSLLAQVGLYLLGAVGWTGRANRFRPARLAAHFDMIVIASLAALALSMTARVKATWAPERAGNAARPAP